MPEERAITLIDFKFGPFNGHDQWSGKDDEGRYWNVYGFQAAVGKEIADHLSAYIGQSTTFTVTEKEKAKKDGSGNYTARTILGIPGVVPYEPANRGGDMSGVEALLAQILEELKAIRTSGGGVSAPSLPPLPDAMSGGEPSASGGAIDANAAADSSPAQPQSPPDFNSILGRLPASWSMPKKARALRGWLIQHGLEVPPGDGSLVAELDEWIGAQG